VASGLEWQLDNSLVAQGMTCACLEFVANERVGLKNESRGVDGFFAGPAVALPLPQGVANY
jgi:hypothetical protein